LPIPWNVKLNAKPLDKIADNKSKEPGIPYIPFISFIGEALRTYKRSIKNPKIRKSLMVFEKIKFYFKGLTTAELLRLRKLIEDLLMQRSQS
jgi:hypothetical protein